MSRPSQSDSIQTQVELALLQRLSDFDRTYPWDPSAPEAEDYLNELEAELDQVWSEAAWSEEAALQHWQTLSEAVEASWAPETASTAMTSLDQTLFQKFAERMPQSLLQAIAQQARQVVATGQPLAEQLVHCVQDILPQWNQDDLQVMARPLAYAMRGGDAEMLEVALRSVRFAAWTELSGVERARLSLAIARYAIAQLDRPNPSPAQA